ncbi:two-component sensor histidine kinase [Thioclava sp. F28-4]|nr:two-component sensor histidine kinase [Thioclava sp. F28-4]OOY06915.1 two-component sensor histidine kinase [Thioclava sp. F36-7]
MRSLRVQLVLLIIAALGVAQLISLWLFADERSLAIRAALGFEAAGRAANVARLIEEAPADLRPSIIRAANSPLVRFDLTAKPLVQHTDHSDGGVVEARVRGLLNESYSRDIRVELHQIQGAILPLPNLSREMTEMHLAMMRGELSAIEMNLSISIAGGQWLNVSTRFERPPIQWPRYSILTFGLTAMALLVGVTWFVMAGLLGPLRRLVRASDRLGRGENANALPERGPMEVRELTAGFNRMQERLTRFVTDRTRVLAALGHDLRSPLTAMRVHSEMVEEEELRENLVSTVEEMQSMVEATLTFAKGLSGSEEMQEVELQTFLETLQTDMVASFGLTAGPTVRVRLRPNATRRALRNVIENAVRYGGSATVGWQVLGEDIEITISDKGPGIPASDLERVFDPFVRLEESRSLETGGHGLGLSIARSILHGQGGEISLANHPGGGLVATVRLPKAKPQLD